MCLTSKTQTKGETRMKKLLFGVAVCLFASFVGCSNYAEDAYESIQIADIYMDMAGMKNAEMVQITNHIIDWVKQMDDGGRADKDLWNLASESCQNMSGWATDWADNGFYEGERLALLAAAAEYSTAGDCFQSLVE
jgi:hypothetical protein